MLAVLPSSGLTQNSPPTQEAPWWNDAVIYEVYPRSFQDSDGDGIGDIRGIIRRLDYLTTLGVDAIWLTPIYPSPQIDFGYDISDYCAIDPLFGTMADFNHLIEEAKRRNIRVLMDLVMNHTSNEHPWFIESASSKTSPKRDWYIWTDGRQHLGSATTTPNNWLSRTQQSAWHYDSETDQFYYHYFAPEQPDLNWRNAAVEKAMFDVARFWFDRGVAGFRLDAFNVLFEDESLRDESKVPGTNEYGEPSLSQVRQRDLPEVHTVLQHLRTMTDSYSTPRLLIGEFYTHSTAELATWYGSKQDELQLPMNTNVGFLDTLDAGAFRVRLEEAESLGPARMPLLIFDNHDRPRSWDRYGDGKHNLEIAKQLAVILLASRDTALVYQGQELGMETATPLHKEDVRDPRGRAGWPTEKGRDGERTPMQWTAASNAGFSSSPTPWLPVEPSFSMKNVESESADGASLLSWYKALISLKHQNAAIRTGTFTSIDLDKLHVLAWRLDQGDAGVLVMCNMSAASVSVPLSSLGTALQLRDTTILLDSQSTSKHSSGEMLRLTPYQTLVFDTSRL